MLKKKHTTFSLFAAIWTSPGDYRYLRSTWSQELLALGLRASSLLVPLILSISVSVSGSGCAKTQQARRVETSGFLEDYSQLQEGKEDEALLVYINPAADFSLYDKVLLDDVTVWRAADSDLQDVPEEDIEELALELHEAMVENLKEDYETDETAADGSRERA